VICHGEHWRSLYLGTSLALFGVSNALQFMGYEKIKGWEFKHKLRGSRSSDVHRCVRVSPTRT
jgi:hypothetical protein